ncbi:type I pullulanase [Mollicutes bacterium LVI A0078]|nr:type I pullulanase [Mollicutes bacterium LVI A0075]WOO90362.1 type I pullulanase [Mollicutes bacterium LVI A0078]
MFIESPYKAYIESYNHIWIETTEELQSVILEHNQHTHELALTKLKKGYHADIRHIDINMQNEMFVHINKRYKEHVNIGMITTTIEFDIKNQSDIELGAIYSKNCTIFRVWTPVATDVILVLEKNNSKQTYVMNGDGRHYSLELEGDYEGYCYYYLVCVAGQYNKVVDPYALNLTANTGAGIIVDQPKLVTEHKFNSNDKSKMVIYETSVCDFTSDKNCNFTHKGKYIGFNQSLDINGKPIGIDYVKELGITHIQLMPIYDFGSVNEQYKSDNNYNWGYDPVHYNVPEGSYVVGTDTYSRIEECKQMIDGIKNNDIGVIMDVVYNHVYDASSFNYNLLVPNYYFRFKPNREYSNGSFCGNEVASERAMVRRYIIDTLKTWVNIYGIDGIRIDLMGLMDIETIRAIENELTAIHPNFIIYGEGWNMESMLTRDKRAAQINADKLPTVGHFNDDLRNFIKGDNSEYDKIGYIQGNNDTDSLQVILDGKALDDEKKYVNEYQLINYVSCHDDHTLYDYLKMNESNEQVLTAQIIEAYKYVFKAKGIPFIHSGCEFKRTKEGHKNTYNKSRQLNSIKWNQVMSNEEIINAVKLLIKEK